MKPTGTQTGKPGKKFIGLRVDGDKAEQLQALADDRGVSVNELLNSVLDELPDSDLTAEIADRRVSRGINQGNDQVDELLRKFDMLVRLLEYLEVQREKLESEKPDGILEDLFVTKRFEDWQRKMDAIEEKWERLRKKMDEVQQRLLKRTLSEDDPEEPADSEDERPAPKRKSRKKVAWDEEEAEESDDHSDDSEEDSPPKRKPRK